MTAIDISESRVARATGAFCQALGESNEPAVTGGKAYALGRMLRAEMPVPGGFVILADALQQHLAQNGVDERIAKLCAELDVTDSRALQRAAAAIRSLVSSVTIPSDVWRDVMASARPLLARGAVVVRSSAIGEDGVGESFAGQLDSILHVDSEAALRQALLDCWSSLWSERVLFYRSARHLEALGMGVVVQQQVDAIAAGVLFTATTDGVMLVEFAPGLGDALVSGAIDPGRMTIDRTTGAVERLADVVDASGAPFELGPTVASALRDVGVALEREFGSPQDVEWAIASDGALSVVQSRPITAPVKIDRTSRPAANANAPRMIAWSNANVNENFPAPISPLLYSIASQGYTHYFRNLAVAFGIAPERIVAMEPAFQQIIGVHGARMYYNLTSIHSVLRLAPFGKALTGSFDAFVGADGTDVQTNTATRSGRWRQIAEVAVIAVKTAKRFAGIDRGIRRFERTVDEFAEQTTDGRLAKASLGELRTALGRFMEIRCNRWLDASLADAASMLCYGALERLLRRAYAGTERGALHTSLLKAIPNVVSGEPVLQLWNLSRLVRSDAELMRCVEEKSAIEALASIRSDSRFARFRAAFQRYLDEWGFRCSEELMLTSPSFQENPAPVIEMIRAYARIDGDTPADALRTQAAEREAATRGVFAELRGRVVWRGVPVTYAVLLGVLLPWTHAAIRYRERARLKQALLYSRCRRVALAIGGELARREVIVEQDDVFFLTASELMELTGGAAMFPRAVRPLIATRKAEHARLSATSPPDAFTLPEGEYLDTTSVSPHAMPADSDGRLRGTSACGGRITGRATVLRDVTEAGRLERGDVLVTKQTDPGWGPVFFLISGLVIERGGMLSHGAIIAREFGIPCVVGIKEATRRIRSGSTITVDGDRGEVHEAHVAD